MTAAELFGGRKLILAPMAGVTDYAYRTVCADHGVDITVTEMVSSRALIYGDKKSFSLMKKTPKGICGVQLFGNDPQIMAQAAVLAVDHSGCDFIDINMGCPVPKIAGNGDGSALMRSPELAGRIVAAVKAAVSVPVTVKCRLGWDKGSINVVEFAQKLAASGADAIAVHGRTKTMQYSGIADWDTIRKVVDAVSVPVIANGDIFDAEAALRCIARTGTEALMVGRGAFGDPFVFDRIRAAMEHRTVPEPVSLAEKMDAAHRQFLLCVEDKGEYIACLEARKYLAWYLRGVKYSGFFKEKIARVTTCAEVETILAGIVRELK